MWVCVCVLVFAVFSGIVPSVDKRFVFALDFFINPPRCPPPRHGLPRILLSIAFLHFLQELQELMFPAEHAPAPASAVAGGETSPAPASSMTAVFGAGAAKLDAASPGRGRGQDAVGVKLWVRLAQAPSQQMSALAARWV